MTGARFDFAALEFAEPFGTELFDGIAAEHGAVDHGAAESGVVRTAAAGQVAHETAGKRVARSRGVVGFFQGESGNAKNAALVHNHGSIFAAFYDQSGRSQVKNMPSRQKEIVFAGKL